ncbi:SWIRM domain-containing protein [Coccidioides immitis RS]|uniref:SWIRM domain-containing protein n=3 Tax=Coccidioides immitis TaxID=5501 RepID=J3KLM2_COCIM|nr:SWIRM domain-containing protein [Coccidioides immitis RS]EAS37208.3 SWIRM domain-containing protein [Coccidioides immitis RS]KMP10154.1 SWIRM domain-containing protein FUN19 [Coccidioides immitis RMSCC 2394]KMU80778.1 SWIRM domain containing protein [Coccidioides immitis RMSCC 3703]
MNRLPPVSSLVSPPEPKPFDSFNSDLYSQLPFSPSDKLPPIAPERAQPQSDMDLPSPPVTPYNGSKRRHTVDGDNGHTTSNAIAGPSRDPVLFPSDRRSSLLEHEPLFGPESVPDAEALVDKHIASKKSTAKGKFQQPTRDEYMLALSCVSRVISNYNRNPRAYAIQERKIFDYQWTLVHPGKQTKSKLKKIAPAPSRRGNASAPRVQKSQRPKRSSPKTKVVDSFDATPTRNPPKPRVIGTNRDDTDYNSLPDYCPPISTLHGTKGLKADWKGQMLDLSNDPNRDALDPAEINLAATLRLSCATYLCSKRRIFQALLNKFSENKEFRKTDAQQACKIDVNKASKLWTAFERVGWFKREHFIHHLEN